MKKLLSILLVALMALTLTACGSKNAEEETEKELITKIGNYELVTPGKLTVATSTDFAPYEFVDMSSGSPVAVGSDISLAKMIAEYLGLELEVYSAEFDTLLVALDNHMADIAIAGFSYTSDRAASYTYTDCYYGDGDGGQVVIASIENEGVYTNLADLNNADVKVAAQVGAIQVDLVSEQLADATLVKITDLNAVYDELSKGSVQAVAIAKNVADTLIAAQPGKYFIVDSFDFEDSGSYGLVKLGNTDLANAVNEAIATMDDGQYDAWVKEAQDLQISLGDNAVEANVIEAE